MSNTEKTNSTIKSWFDRYADDLYSWAFYKTSAKETAEDLVQETFLSAVRGIEGFQNNCEPKTWLFSILNHKIIDHYRKNNKSSGLNGKKAERKALEQTDSFFDANQNWKVPGEEVVWEAEAHLLDNQAFKEILDICVGKLPDNWRLAVVSKYLSEKKTGQICRELEVTRANYWQIVHRAKLMLKKCIDHNWER